MSICFGKGGEFYEESSWIYSFSAPQDQIKLIELMGGPEQYVKRLDHYFDKGYHDMGDEPGKSIAVIITISGKPQIYSINVCFLSPLAFLIPYLYNWAGRIDKTTDIIRTLLRTHFSTNSSGLPGEDMMKYMKYLTSKTIIFNNSNLNPLLKAMTIVVQKDLLLFGR
jgi:putative alpha-1,2-mannosidase